MEAENRNPSIWAMFKFVFGTVLQRRGLLVLNVVALTLITLLQFVMPQIEQYIIDTVIPAKSTAQLAVVIALLLAVAVGLGLMTYFSSYYMTVMSQGAIFTLRNQLYDQLLDQDTAFFESSKTGDLMTRLTSDISNLQSLISANMLSMIGNLFTFVGVLVLIFWINWQMALAVSLTFPLMFIVYHVFRPRIRNSFRAARTTQGKMSNRMQQTLTQIDLIKSYTSEKVEARRFDEIAAQNKDELIAAGRNQALFSPLIDGINTLGIAIVLGLGAMFIMRGQLKVGQLVAYLSYVAMVQSPIQALTRLLNQLQQAVISFGRIQAISNVHPTVIDGPTAVAFPGLNQQVALDHVTFGYGSRQILHDISFTIEAGKTTALVGRSGSGKTTITRLLVRLYDVLVGTITYDGVPLTQIQLQSLRQHVAIVSQDIYILDGSIRDNVLYGRPGASDEAVWQALQTADLANFVRGLDQQLATQVGERGVKLSGGQKQRLAIARAVLKNAPFIILDEATASLDNESEKAIQHALDNLLADRTSLVIAHRLSTVQNAAKIVVIENGRVVEQGSHRELLAAGGAYAKLYQAQFE